MMNFVKLNIKYRFHKQQIPDCSFVDSWLQNKFVDKTSILRNISFDYN